MPLALRYARKARVPDFYWSYIYLATIHARLGRKDEARAAVDKLFEKVELRLAAGEVHIWVALPRDTLWVCPECHVAAPIHDHRERVWRHLDACQYRTLVHARVPRLACPTHGTRQVRVPWAEEGSRFTALFEALAIEWLKRATIYSPPNHPGGTVHKTTKEAGAAEAAERHV